MRKIKASKISERHYQVDMRGWVCPYPKYAAESLVKNSLEEIEWISSWIALLPLMMCRKL